MGSVNVTYSPTNEAQRILACLCKQSQALNLPDAAVQNQDAVTFHSTTDSIYFPIPFKETETLAALKAVEGLVAGEIANLRFGTTAQKKRSVEISLEAATYFACQAYMAKVGGLGKLDPGVRAKLKGTVGLDCVKEELMLIFARYRSPSSSIKWISKNVCQSLQDQGRAIFSHPRLPRSHYDTQYDWSGGS